METLKLRITVTAGVILGEPMPEYTRSWEWSNLDQEAIQLADKSKACRAARDKWLRVAGESREYAATLENPEFVNWVRREWIWL